MIIGIDLGTTNSACAVWRDGAARLIPNRLGHMLTPSAVSVDADGTILSGLAARERQSSHPSDTGTAFKRYMGTKRTTRLGKHTFTAEELSAIILRSLKEDAEAFLGETVTEAVITVPAYFNDKQRKATRRAGELAGLSVRRLINEPTAAALAFGLASRGEHEPFLVFDLGGGTFDVSIVEMFAGIVEVRASAGDNRLGGDDFNEALANALRARLDPDGLLGRQNPERARALLLQAAERTRRALSDKAEAELAVTVEDRRLAVTVTTADLEAAVEPLLRRLRDPVVRALRDSQIDTASLSEVVLVGGATRMPVVRKAITRLFGRFPNSTVHPDHAVALGAAIQGGLIVRDGGLDEVRITDVCPFTLGVDRSERDGRGGVVSGLFTPIIERNTPVPVSRVHYFQTMGDNQRRVEFGIFQGEAREVSGNVRLGGLDIAVPPRPAGEVQVDVRFSYDSSGLLEVDVSIPLTGESRNVVFVDEEDRKDAAELDRRRRALAAIKVHPREEAANQALLARAERMWEDHLGDVREAIGHWIIAFQTALESQDHRTIAQASADLAMRLDSLDAEMPL